LPASLAGLTGVAVALAVAVAATLLIAVTVFGEKGRDLTLLGIFLATSGTASLALGSGGMVLAERQRAGLRFKLAIGHILGVVVLLINIVVTAVLMFLSSHDLAVLSLLLFFSGALAIYFGASHSRSLVRSLRDLTDAASQMADGNLETRVETMAGDEVGVLGEAFNRMAAQLEAYAARQRDLEQARRDLIAAVSHDLRTPLASIRVMVEALRDHVVDDPETVERYYQTILGETGHLNALIEDLFELSRIEAGVLQLDLAPSSLQDLIATTLRSMEPRALQKDLDLVGRVPPDLATIRIDVRRIQRVLVNLVENAIRYTPRGGRVAVSAVADADLVRVDVADSGPGISSTDLPMIFDRFYRGERSRSRESGGAGLGLAIARGIVEAHGGTIAVASEPGHGSVFSVTLPRQSSATTPR